MAELAGLRCSPEATAQFLGAFFSCLTEPLATEGASGWDLSRGCPGRAKHLGTWEGDASNSELELAPTGPPRGP